MSTSLEEVDGCGLESLFFSSKYIQITPLESITQLKIPIHVSQHTSCHIWLYFYRFSKYFPSQAIHFLICINHSRFQEMFVNIKKCIAWDGKYFVTNNEKYDHTKRLPS